MALNNLTYFELDGGTSENPLVLTAQQLDGLINLIKKANCTSDVRGYVTTETGHIAAYQKHLLENAYPNLNILVRPEDVDPDIWDIKFTNGSNVIELPEGNEVRFVVTGIDLSLLNFNLFHSTSGIATEAAQRRISIEGNVIKCTPPNDNYNWSDSVTVTVYPEYNSSDFHTLTVNIRATSVQNMSLVGYSSEVGTNAYLNITANLLPSNHTKSSCVVITAESSNEGGGSEYPISVTGTTIRYRVPYVTQACQATVTAYARISGSSAIIASDTAHLSIVLPTLRAYVTADGSPDSTHKISITDTETGAITELGNTESMSTVEGRTYILGAAPDYSGYTSEFTITGATLTNNQFVATSGVISISLVYTAKQPNIYVVYSETDSNGKNYYESLSSFIDRGTHVEGYTIEGICIDLGLVGVLPFVYSMNNPYVETVADTGKWTVVFSGTPSDPNPNIDSYIGRTKYAALNTTIDSLLKSYSWPGNTDIYAYTADTGEIISFFNNVSRAVVVFQDRGDILPMRQNTWIPYGTTVPGPVPGVKVIQQNNNIISTENVGINNLLILYTWNPRFYGTKLD